MPWREVAVAAKISHKKVRQVVEKAVGRPTPADMYLDMAGMPGAVGVAEIARRAALKRVGETFRPVLRMLTEAGGGERGRRNLSRIHRELVSTVKRIPQKALDTVDDIQYSKDLGGAYGMYRIVEKDVLIDPLQILVKRLQGASDASSRGTLIHELTHGRQFMPANEAEARKFSVLLSRHNALGQVPLRGREHSSLYNQSPVESQARAVTAFLEGLPNEWLGNVNNWEKAISTSLDDLTSSTASDLLYQYIKGALPWDTTNLSKLSMALNSTKLPMPESKFLEDLLALGTKPDDLLYDMSRLVAGKMREKGNAAAALYDVSDRWWGGLRQDVVNALEGRQRYTTREINDVLDRIDNFLPSQTGTWAPNTKR